MPAASSHQAPPVTGPHLDRNLDALGPALAGLAAEIRAAGPRAGLEFASARDGRITGTLDGISLASRVRPGEEADRIAGGVDIETNAAIVVYGFGLGWHVAALARRMKRTGAIIVVEPDRALLHSVLSMIDHRDAIAATNLIIVTDPDDRTTMMRHVEHAEFVLGQGIAFVDHAPSRARLGDAPVRFGAIMSDIATHVRLTLSTTLIRSVDTVRNLTSNLHRFAVAPGIAELANAQSGRPGIVLSAGPSLAPALDRLADPAVREHAVLIAAQTTLKPLLARGIRPHFVTALDYHRISTRFYEGLTAADLDGIELVVDPKAHPAILDAFPGTIRCIDNRFLNQLLGPDARSMGRLKDGATVAHLSTALARHLGCDPLLLVGQDLGFTDGLYYGPGAAIHETWDPELGPFNPVTEMEWQRIARHRRHLVPLPSWDDRTVLSDAQMLTYLQRFEQDFAADVAEGRRVIDCSGPGATRKTGAESMSLEKAIETFARTPLHPFPSSRSEDTDRRRRTTRDRVLHVRREVDALGNAARRAGTIVDGMLEHQDDPVRMRDLFRSLDDEQRAVADRPETFGLVEHLNQLGAFNRVRADRRLTLAADLDPRSRQRFELERDAANVSWIGDACDELVGQLEDAAARLEGRDPGTRRRRSKSTPAAPAPAWPLPGGREPDISDANPAMPDVPLSGTEPAAGRVGAVVAFGDEDAPRLTRPFDGTTLLDATLRRIAESTTLDVVVIARPDGGPAADVPLPGRIGDTDVVTVDVAPDAVHRRAVDAARSFASGAWRGGIAGVGGLDAGLSPNALRAAIEQHDLAAVVSIGPDRPLLDPAAGIDALVERWREHPGVHRLVFTPLPPGVGGVLLRRDLASELDERSRFGTVGPLLVHQPSRPQGDPIATDACVVASPAARGPVDAIASTPGAADRLASAIASMPDSRLADDADTAARFVRTAAVAERAARATRPEHLLLELVCGGEVRPYARCGVRTTPRSVADVDRLVTWLGNTRLEETAVTIAGEVDPLEHPRWREVVTAVHAAGARAVHVRTRLVVDQATARSFADLPVDIWSVDLHAFHDAVHSITHGPDAAGDLTIAREAIEALADARGGRERLGGPWIVPRLVRTRATLPDLDAFHEWWMHRLGAVVIDPRGPWPGAAGPDPLEGSNPVLPMPTPPRAVDRELDRRLLVRADGSMPADELAPATGDEGAAASLETDAFSAAWTRVRAARADARAAGRMLRIREP